MGEGPLQIGDRVVSLQVPGIFVVLGRKGPLVEIESERGLRMTVAESGLRRPNGAAVPKDDPE